MRDAQASAAQIRQTLDPKRRDFTVADAAAASGLSLQEAEQGLHALISEYRGHLRVTEDGDILFRFVHGFEKPWEVTDGLTKAARAVGRFAAGAARFIVRAWVAIVLVGYALLFVALFIALTMARSGSDRDSGRGMGIGVYVFRFIAEALFWTFHPFSPFYARGDVGWGAARQGFRRAAPEGPKVPLYERIDRFFFGPKPPPEDAEAPRLAIISEIRALKGRIGMADVMRVTGLTRDRIDPLMSRLLVDFEGSVEVSEEGGIVYRFPDLRKTVADRPTARVRAVWDEKQKLPPVTGNPLGHDVAIGLLNGFNLLASGWVIAQGLTIERMIAIFSGVPVIDLPPPGFPIALGIVPFLFSLALFALPLFRLAARPLLARRVARDNGRRALLKGIIEGSAKGGVTERDLALRYRIAAGVEPSSRWITKEVVALGGDIDLDGSEDGVRYRFPDLELEAKALEAEREAASDDEARVGQIVFSSEDDLVSSERERKPEAP